MMTDIQKVSFAIACLNTSIVGASLMEAMHNRNDLGVVLNIHYHRGIEYSTRGGQF